jgi:hypothetical protein
LIDIGKKGGREGVRKEEGRIDGIYLHMHKNATRKRKRKQGERVWLRLGRRGSGRNESKGRSYIDGSTPREGSCPQDE